MDASTITSSSFTLTPAGGSAVAATVALSGNTATLTPSAALASNTAYTAKLDTTVKAADGVALAKIGRSSCRAGEEVSVVAASLHADGATAVATSIAPAATFSRAMDASTITSPSFTLTPSGGSPVAASVSYSGSVATLTPSAALATNTVYTAKLDTSVKAADGVAIARAYSWQRTNVYAAPAAYTNKPAKNATAVATSIAPTATFSRAMDATTITSSSFTLTPAGGSAVAASVSYSGSVATLTPSAALASNTVYTAKLDTTVKASDGVALASAYSWQFTTVNAAPTVTANTPANNATAVATSVAPTATFSRAMDASTITSSSFTLTPSGGCPVAAPLSLSGATATVTPSPAPASNTVYPPQ